ncbi:unnamed protein product [Schistocephalus solidus]|uniref:NIBRIN_BRCT_II domain-containing protein n=1 Tax=Schistocephalus solidus TaxID=70667 RepID=A0A183T1R1_SCHSO|nr:unnamed protein product [Schistocephalus solidus]
MIQDGDTLPDLSIVDLSKFGTSVNGKALNKSTLSLESGSKITFGALPGVTVTLGDETQVRAALRNRLASTTACVLYESSATTFYNSDQSWHATVYTVLQELQLRPILEQEIAFAIIEASSASVCNPRILWPLTSEQNNTENNELLEDPGSPRKRRRILQTGPISRLLPPDCPLNNALARGRSKILVPDTEALPASCTLVSDYADTVEDYPSPGRQIVGRPPKWSPGSSDLLEEEEPDRKPTSDNLSLGASIGRTSVTVSSPFSTTKQSIVTAGASPKEEFSENRVDQAVLNAFDSLPSLSTLIKWPTFKHPEEFPGSDASFGENANRTVNYRFSVQEPVLSNAEKENISPCPRTALSTAIVVNSSAQGHRVSECLVTGEFLSKEKGHRATVESAVACAKVEFAALCTLRPTRIPKAVPASVYSDFKTVNFKRFRKVPLDRKCCSVDCDASSTHPLASVFPSALTRGSLTELSRLFTVDLSELCFL